MATHKSVEHKHQPEANISNNFAVALPEAQAAYANEVFKDSYCMGFIGVTEPLLELELEGTIQRISPI